MSVGVVVAARNEGENIEPCLVSLRSQYIPLYVVVVDDGSLNGTAALAEKYADCVIHLPHHEASYAGRPELAEVFNAGLAALGDFTHIMISGADTVFPRDYVESIREVMKRYGAVVASGEAEHERGSWHPRGSGRVINSEWFHTVGFSYPVNYGFESYLVYKALSQGKKVTVTNNSCFALRRKTQGGSSEKIRSWGRGMNALQYCDD